MWARRSPGASGVPDGRSRGPPAAEAEGKPGRVPTRPGRRRPELRRWSRPAGAGPGPPLSSGPLGWCCAGLGPRAASSGRAAVRSRCGGSGGCGGRAVPGRGVRWRRGVRAVPTCGHRGSGMAAGAGTSEVEKCSARGPGVGTDTGRPWQTAFRCAVLCCGPWLSVTRGSRTASGGCSPLWALRRGGPARRWPNCGR